MSVHRPVMLNEVLEALAPKAGAVFVDGTFGGGGYSRALLARARCAVYAFDRDTHAIEAGQEQTADGSLTLIHASFSAMREELAARDVAAVDGVTLDLGLSSDQLGAPERGFSFQADGPLDMRMDQTGPSAADLIAHSDERDLARIFSAYGEEPQARRVAKAIVAARALAPITRTGALATIVRRAAAAERPGIDRATRTFQALRSAVNDELGELDRGLSAAEAVLKPAGRLAVVSFHSLEDRRVKLFLRARALAGAAQSRHLPATDRGRRPPSFRLLSRKAIKPTPEEIRANPRARSARLRIAERTDAAAWEMNSPLGKADA